MSTKAFTNTIMSLALSAVIAVALTACAGRLPIEPRKTTPYALTGQEEAASPSRAIGYTRVKPAQYEPPSRSR